MGFKHGDKVTVAKNTVTLAESIYAKDRNAFIGKTAEVVENKSLTPKYQQYEYKLKFDDYDLERQNRCAGGWLWSTEELELFVEAEIPQVRIIIEADRSRKTIYSFPAIIHVISDGMKQFKGVSKCLAEDTYDEAKGKEIAMLKAEIKQKEYKLRQLIK